MTITEGYSIKPGKQSGMGITISLASYEEYQKLKVKTLDNFKKWDEKVKNHDETNPNEETKMAVELSEIIIGWKRGIPSVYEDCEDIEWIDGDGYDELHFIVNGRDNTLKIFHGSVDSIRVIW
jgi:hypothetical protein